MNKLTEEQLRGIEALLEKATPGPWKAEGDGAITNRETDDPRWDVGEFYDHDNAALIVALVNAAPELLSVVEERDRLFKSLYALECAARHGGVVRDHPEQIAARNVIEEYLASKGHAR